MIGFIKKLISGIVNFIVGLFGGKKGSDYYLELKEDTNEDNLASNVKTAVQIVTSSTPEVVETAKTNTEKAVETVTSKIQEVAETAKTKKKKAAKKVAETAPVVTNGKKDPAITTTTITKAKAPIAEKPQETTFAPDYLVPTSSNGRRRPGANMSSFLDMARQVKTPN